MRHSHVVVIAIVGVGLTMGAFCSAVEAQSIPWRYDYNAARKEALAKNVPLLLDFGTANCFFCKKLDETTFRDPKIRVLLSQEFIPVKVQAEKYMPVVRALRIQSYPTLVFAAPTGHILAKHEGYVNGQQLAHQLTSVLRHIQQASYVANVQPQQKQQMPAQPIVPGNPKRSLTARGILTQAQKDFQARDFVCCLARCRMVTTSFADLPEANDARQLMEKITADVNETLRVCEQLTDTLGELYLQVARSWLQKNQPQQAIPYLQWVSQACPGTPHARIAQMELLRIQQNTANVSAK